MTYYDGSILSVEWTNQHGCGGNEATDPQALNCNMVLQYMCDTNDAASTYASAAMKSMRVHLKDGTSTDTPTAPNSFGNAATLDTVANAATGRHESPSHYQECRTRKRNNALFTADQQLKGSTAQFTRQNPGGNRNGLECPEERDYYPYWHPSPWIDVAYLHDSLTTADACAKIVAASQNTLTYYKCYASAAQLAAGVDSAAAVAAIAARTEAQCAAAAGSWTGFTHAKAAPACEAATWSRENHLGNTNAKPASAIGGGVVEPPQAARYQWRLPSWTELTATGNTRAAIYSTTVGGVTHEYARCVYRLRYNISTDDYDPAKTSAAQNRNDKTGVRSPINENPTVDIGAGMQALRLAINTAQTGRTFQDRSHVFTIKNRASMPVVPTGEIYNLNVRGKRGNIVQTYPAVEVRIRAHLHPLCVFAVSSLTNDASVSIWVDFERHYSHAGFVCSWCFLVRCFTVRLCAYEGYNRSRPRRALSVDGLQHQPEQ